MDMAKKLAAQLVHKFDVLEYEVNTHLPDSPASKDTLQQLKTLCAVTDLLSAERELRSMAEA
jgi:hypothetical protein